MAQRQTIPLGFNPYMFTSRDRAPAAPLPPAEQRAATERLARQNRGYEPGAARKSDMNFLRGVGSAFHFKPGWMEGRRQSTNIEDRRGETSVPMSDAGETAGLPIAQAVSDSGDESLRAALGGNVGLSPAIMSAKVPSTSGAGGIARTGDVDLSRIDPALAEIVIAGAQHLPPGYRVVISEGHVDKPPPGYKGPQHSKLSQHYTATGAVDLAIYKPDGTLIPNKGGDETGMYGLLSRNVYGEMLSRHPELKSSLNWGGDFGVTLGSSVSDLMHYDLGGNESFRKGFAEKMAKRGTEADQTYGVGDVDIAQVPVGAPGGGPPKTYTGEGYTLTAGVPKAEPGAPEATEYPFQGPIVRDANVPAVGDLPAQVSVAPRVTRGAAPVQSAPPPAAVPPVAVPAPGAFNYQKPNIVNVSDQFAKQFNPSRINQVTGQPLGPLKGVNGIVTHWTGNDSDTLQGVFDTLHQRDLVSQFVVDRDGTVYQTMPDGSQGWHVSSRDLNSKIPVSNLNSIGIEFVGKTPTDAQKAAAPNLFGYLTKDPAGAGWGASKLTSDQVYGHGEINPGHKEEGEGVAFVDAIKAAYPAGAPAPAAEAGAPGAATSADLDAMADMAYREARGEGRKGMLATMQVVDNRRKAATHPGDYGPEVGVDRWAGQSLADLASSGEFAQGPVDRNSPQWKQARADAEAVAAGTAVNDVGDSLFFANDPKADPARLALQQKAAPNEIKLGNHTFRAPNLLTAAPETEVAGVEPVASPGLPEHPLTHGAEKAVAPAGPPPIDNGQVRLPSGRMVSTNDPMFQGMTPAQIDAAMNRGAGGRILTPDAPAEAPVAPAAPAVDKGAAAPAAGARPTMWGWHGQETKAQRAASDKAFARIAAQNGMEYKPLDADGDHLKEMTNEGIHKIRVGDGVVAFSAGANAFINAVNNKRMPDGLASKVVLIGANADHKLNTPFTSTQVTEVQSVKGVDHLALPDYVANQGAPVAPAEAPAAPPAAPPVRPLGAGNTFAPMAGAPPVQAPARVPGQPADVIGGGADRLVHALATGDTETAQQIIRQHVDGGTEAQLAQGVTELASKDPVKVQAALHTAHDVMGITVPDHLDAPLRDAIRQNFQAGPIRGRDAGPPADMFDYGTEGRKRIGPDLADPPTWKTFGLRTGHGQIGTATVRTGLGEPATVDFRPDVGPPAPDQPPLFTDADFEASEAAGGSDASSSPMAQFMQERRSIIEAIKDGDMNAARQIAHADPAGAAAAIDAADPATRDVLVAAVAGQSGRVRGGAQAELPVPPPGRPDVPDTVLPAMPVVRPAHAAPAEAPAVTAGVPVPVARPEHPIAPTAAPGAAPAPATQFTPEINLALDNIAKGFARPDRNNLAEGYRVINEHLTKIGIAAAGGILAAATPAGQAKAKAAATAAAMPIFTQLGIRAQDNPAVMAGMKSITENQSNWILPAYLGGTKQLLAGLKQIEDAKAAVKEAAPKVVESVKEAAASPQVQSAVEGVKSFFGIGGKPTETKTAEVTTPVTATPPVLTSSSDGAAKVIPASVRTPTSIPSSISKSGPSLLTTPVPSFITHPEDRPQNVQSLQRALATPTPAAQYTSGVHAGKDEPVASTDVAKPVSASGGIEPSSADKISFGLSPTGSDLLKDAGLTKEPVIGVGVAGNASAVQPGDPGYVTVDDDLKQALTEPDKPTVKIVRTGRGDQKTAVTTGGGGSKGGGVFSSGLPASVFKSIGALEKAGIGHTPTSMLGDLAAKGYSMPNFSAGSGGASMAYHPGTGSTGYTDVHGNFQSTGTYVDSHGQEHSYDMG